MIHLKSTTVVWSLEHTRARPILLLPLLFSVATEIACNGLNASKTSGNSVFLNRDLSAGDLSQWTHQDYGLGTDVGGNTRGGGYLLYHQNVAGRRAAGMTLVGARAVLELPTLPNLAAHLGHVPIRGDNLVERP